MFTGIIETTGTIQQLKREDGNLHLTIASAISSQLKIDQSVAHNGVCLTVVAVEEHTHTVTAIEETLKKSNLSSLQAGSLVNLERCTKVNDRLDGHMVQGHVDQTGECVQIEPASGSTVFTFRYQPSRENLVVEKGSVCVNGISLTAFAVNGDKFSVAIIPYTFEHTNIQQIQVGSSVNLEFDIIGKYVAALMQRGF